MFSIYHNARYVEYMFYSFHTTRFDGRNTLKKLNAMMKGVSLGSEYVKNRFAF